MNAKRVMLLLLAMVIVGVSVLLVEGLAFAGTFSYVWTHTQYPWLEGVIVMGSLFVGLCIGFPFAILMLKKYY